MTTYLAIALAVALAGTFQADRSANRAPKKGDSILVKGCLRGRSLESTETSIVDSDAATLTSFVYRLSGDKSLLKKLREEHEGSVVEVTGVLKSTLPPDGMVGGRTIGKRVRIGIGSPHVGSGVDAEANRSLPVLEVKNYEGVAVKCGG
jgi:hypothetical protein